MNQANLQTVDWVKFIERKQSLFLMAAFIRPEFPMFAETTGFGFQYEFSLAQGPYTSWYRSQKELDACEEYFARLVETSDPRLEEWAARCHELYADADAMLREFSDPSFVFNATTYASVLRTVEDIFLYSAEVDYFVLTGIELLIKRNTAETVYKRHLDIYEPLRAQSRYPQIGAMVFPQFWKAAALAQTDIDAELFAYATPLELRRLFEQGTRIEAHELLRRKEWCVFWQTSDEGEFKFVYDKNLDIPVLNDARAAMTEFKGNVAFRGVARGKVRIINSADDMHDFEEGDILVSISTNPALMPVILKSGAIVTDEGGIGSHAAIVSREFKKPCIIGTKVATSVLKDGDIVEVDANIGVVRKIEK